MLLLRRKYSDKYPDYREEHTSNESDRCFFEIFHGFHSQTAAPGYAMCYAWGIRHLDGDPWIKTRIDDPEHSWLWKEIGSGMALVGVLRDWFHQIRFIAEDLGFPSPDVVQLLEDSGFPGMKVMQFAFDGTDNPNLLHNIQKNSVVYTGTHDNQTTVGFLNSCDSKTKKLAKK